MKCFEPTITDRDVQLVSELLRSGNIGFGSIDGVYPKFVSRASGAYMWD